METELGRRCCCVAFMSDSSTPGLVDPFLLLVVPRNLVWIFLLYSPRNTRAKVMRTSILRNQVRDRSMRLDHALTADGSE